MSEGSASSLPELLSNHLRTVRSISEDGSDHSSLQECFRNQVSELLNKNEEIISLKAQLKMEQDGNKLRDAEFAFRAKQYEEEIESLKKKEQELIDTVTKFQTDVVQSHKYDVDVMVNQKNDQIAQVQNKYDKWKNKYHSLSQEYSKMKESSSILQNDNKHLNDKISAQTEEIEKLKQASMLSASSIPEKQEIDPKTVEHINSLSRQIRTLEQQLTKSQVDSKSLQDDLYNQIVGLEDAKKDLEKKLEKATAKIVKQQAKINSLSDENKSISSVSADLTSQIEQENSQLKSKIKSYRQQKQQYEEEFQNMQKLLQHVELEKDSITDILGVESDDIAEHWTNISEKAEQLTNEISSISELQAENEKLRKRLNAALEDSRKPTSSKVQFSANEQYTLSLQSNLKSARAELDRKTELLGKYKTRNAFNHTIELMNHELLKRIDELYFALTGNNVISFRPLILLVIMAKRFLKFTRTQGIDDPSSLQSFGEYPSVSLKVKIDTMKQIFGKLTQETLVLKQTVRENNSMIQQLMDERDDAQLTLRSNSDEVTLNRKKMKFLKKRMVELQTELSSLVSPEIYNSVCEQLEINERKRDKLETKIKDLEEEIEKRTEIERSMNEKVEQYEINSEQSAEVARKSREQYAEKEAEIEHLKLILKDKTKEILALERLVYRQEEKESSNKATFSCLAIENQELLKKNAHLFPAQVESPSTSKIITENNEIDENQDNTNIQDFKKAIKTEINPAFLGQ